MRRQRRPPLYWYCVPIQPEAAAPVLKAAIPPVLTYRSEGSMRRFARSLPLELYSRTRPSVPRSPASRRVLSSHTRPSPSIPALVGAAASFLPPTNRFCQRRSPVRLYLATQPVVGAKPQVTSLPLTPAAIAARFRLNPNTTGR